MLRLRHISDTVVATQEQLAVVQDDLRSLRGVLEGHRQSAVDAERTSLRQISFARNAAERAAKRATLQRRSLRVVFLAHNRDTWDSVDEVIRIMEQSDDFDPVVVTIPHHYGGGTSPRGEGRMHRFLRERGVPHLRLRKEQLTWARELLFALDPDVVVRQSQWDSDVDEAFSTASLAWTRLILIPYETMNPTRNVPWDYPPVDSALDQHWHRAAWLVFCANEEVRRLAEERTLTGGRQFRVVGHPKADALRRTPPRWPLTEDSGHGRILWSAHHSILTGWNDFGTFPQVMEAMLTWAREEPTTDFVFTHHPYLPGTMRRPERPLSSAEFDRWLDRWTELPNTFYWRGAYAPVLAAADVVVTDGPSMITEAQVLAKPTVFIERAGHIEFNELGERIVTGVHRVGDVSGARDVTTRLFADGDPLSIQQTENSRRLFGEPGAAQRIVDTIRDEARRESVTRSGD